MMNIYKKQAVVRDEEIVKFVHDYILRMTPKYLFDTAGRLNNGSHVDENNNLFQNIGSILS
jgi:hypothetical protein